MTHTAKHTPGPWVTNKNAVVPCIYGPDDNLIATIHPHRKRDINLIAAAPAMYEALTRLVAYHTTIAGLPVESGILDAMAALAEAEGRQP